MVCVSDSKLLPTSVLRPIAAAFPTDQLRPVLQPSIWLQELSQDESFQAAQGVLVGDVRVSTDKLWMARFRSELRNVLNPKVAVWIGIPGEIQAQLAVLEDGAAGEWLCCQLCDLTQVEALALGRRTDGVRLSLSVTLDAENQRRADHGGLINLAWTAKPDAVAVDMVATEREEFSSQALAAELEAVSGGHEGGIYLHSLKLRQELLAAGAREREIYEQALRSHLGGVRSYQEQLERQAENLEQVKRIVNEYVNAGIVG